MKRYRISVDTGKFANAIRNCGMTAHKVGEVSGVHEVKISNYRNEYCKSVQVETLARLAEVCKFNIRDVVNETDENRILLAEDLQAKFRESIANQTSEPKQEEKQEEPVEEEPQGLEIPEEEQETEEEINTKIAESQKIIENRMSIPKALALTFEAAKDCNYAVRGYIGSRDCIGFYRFLWIVALKSGEQELAKRIEDKLKIEITKQRQEKI